MCLLFSDLADADEEAQSRGQAVSYTHLWEYIWIGFTCGIPLPECLLQEAVVNASRCGSIFSSLLEAENQTDGRELFLCGKVFQLLAALAVSYTHLCGPAELEDEILEEYHITQEKQKLCLKGDMTVCIHGKELELGAFPNGIEFFADELDNSEQITVKTAVFTTVENYTSWLMCDSSKTALFYLVGYATRYQIDFLKKIFSDNPTLVYRHFGDIDAGGL